MSIAAIAGEQHRRVEIVIDVDDSDPIAFDSESAGFDPLELQLGESRSVIDADGNTVFIVRTEDGFEIETNGRRVAVPDPAAIADLHLDITTDVNDEDIRRVVIERALEEQLEVHILHEADTDQDVEVEHEIRVVREVVNDTN